MSTATRTSRPWSCRSATASSSTSPRSRPSRARRSMDFHYFLQQIVNGLSVGAIYALIAVGYTMVYGILRLINFAHGDVFMVGAMTALLLAQSLGWTGGFAVLF